MKRAPKDDMTPEQQREYLEKHNIPTNAGPSRSHKFDGFEQYAQEIAGRSRRDYNSRTAVPDRYIATAPTDTNPNNPYAQAAAGNPYASNPYDDSGDSTSRGGSSNPYAAAGGSSRPDSRPPAQNAAYSRDPRPPAQNTAYSTPQPSTRTPAAPVDSYESPQQDSNPYASVSNPYASEPVQPSRNVYAESTYDPSEARNELFAGRTPTQKQSLAAEQASQGTSTTLVSDYSNSEPKAASKKFNFDDNLDELNGIPGESNQTEEDELNEMPSEFAEEHQERQETYRTPEEIAQAEEDEEVEGLKQRIKFTTRETLASTNNALRYAAEAEASGRNTLGMLGSQGERIASAERNLALGKNQSKIAHEQTDELKRLRRGLLVPNVKNPFTSKRKLQEKEARLKSEHLQEQISREHRREEAYASEQRVMNGLNSNGLNYSETAMKHKREQLRNAEGRKKLTFEADSEDEEINDEIDLNLEGISHATSRLKNLAIAQGEELKAQNKRLGRMSDQTDELDTDVHFATARLNAIK